MAEENVIQLMIQLCLAGEKTRYSIVQRIGLNLSNQYLTVAVVSRSELRKRDFSCLGGFYQALHSHIPSIVRGDNHPLAFIHGRVAVVLNKWEWNGTDTFYEHGERRLFDTDKRLLYQLIDEHYHPHPLTERQAERTVLDRALSGMIREYCNNGATLDDAVLLVYSYYIPCNVPGHHCAKLLRRYADETGYTFYIAYTDDTKYTKRNEVQNVLNGGRIILLGRQKFERALNDHEVQEFNDFLNKKESNRYIKRQLKRFRGNEKKQEMIKERIEKMFLRHIYTASENKRKKTKVRQNKEMI